MSYRIDQPLEIPERAELHDLDDDGEIVAGLVGEAQTLPMNPAARAAARRRRDRLEELGGFGFRSAG